MEVAEFRHLMVGVVAARKSESRAERGLLCGSRRQTSTARANLHHIHRIQPAASHSGQQGADLARTVHAALTYAVAII